eukprot:gene1150-677_t
MNQNSSIVLIIMSFQNDYPRSLQFIKFFIPSQLFPFNIGWWVFSYLFIDLLNFSLQTNATNIRARNKIDILLHYFCNNQHYLLYAFEIYIYNFISHFSHENIFHLRTVTIQNVNESTSKKSLIIIMYFSKLDRLRKQDYLLILSNICQHEKAYLLIFQHIRTTFLRRKFCGCIQPRPGRKFPPPPYPRKARGLSALACLARQKSRPPGRVLLGFPLAPKKSAPGAKFISPRGGFHWRTGNDVRVQKAPPRAECLGRVFPMGPHGGGQKKHTRRGSDGRSKKNAAPPPGPTPTLLRNLKPYLGTQNFVLLAKKRLPTIFGLRGTKTNHLTRINRKGGQQSNRKRSRKKKLPPAQPEIEQAKVFAPRYKNNSDAIASKGAEEAFLLNHTRRVPYTVICTLATTTFDSANGSSRYLYRLIINVRIIIWCSGSKNYRNNKNIYINTTNNMNNNNDDTIFHNMRSRQLLYSIKLLDLIILLFLHIIGAVIEFRHRRLVLNTTCEEQIQMKIEFTTHFSHSVSTPFALCFQYLSYVGSLDFIASVPIITHFFFSTASPFSGEVEAKEIDTEIEHILFRPSDSAGALTFDLLFIFSIVIVVPARWASPTIMLHQSAIIIKYSYYFTSTLPPPPLSSRIIKQKRGKANSNNSNSVHLHSYSTPATCNN